MAFTRLVPIKYRFSRGWRILRTKKSLFAWIKVVWITVLVCFVVLKLNNTPNLLPRRKSNHLADRHHLINILRKLNNPFRCYSESESTVLKKFYQLDCENPFLKNLSSRDLTGYGDVCEVFNKSYDGDDNHTLYSSIERDFKHFSKNITYNDMVNIEAACPECHHIQIIDGQLYIVERRTSANFQTRSRSMKTMLRHVTDTFTSIGNLEMFIHTRDIVNLSSPELNRMKHNVPIFGFSKTNYHAARSLHPDNIILIPCFTLWVFTAPNIGRWRSTFETLPKVADKIEWENRVDKVMWRGARNGDRWWLTGIGERRNDSTLDIEFIDWKPGKVNPHYSDNFKTIQQYCQYKYLLHQEGWSYSNRLKYLLLCGSPVIYANFHGWEEYWYHLLQHGYNILVFKDKGNENTFKNLTQAIIHDDEKAKFIGANGRALVQTYLSEQAVLCYFRNVLIKYGKLFTYKPVRHPKAVKFDEFQVGYSS